jgi:hypothetical protein
MTFYEIYYHKSSKSWCLWKCIENFRKDRGMSSYSIMLKGTKKECLEIKKELEKSDRKVQIIANTN